jgi:Rha family phage regulatory protein
MGFENVTIRDGIKELAIFEKHQDAWVSSRTLAKMFDKEHKHVLRSIQEIVDNPDSFTESNFGLSSYKDCSGKTNKEYILNRKAFALIAMGFTGEKAMSFKKQYIDAFEFMYGHIATRQLSKDGYKIMTKAIAQHICNDPLYFALEGDMINQIVLGMSAKKFREINNVDNIATRDAVVTDRLEKLDSAQRLNAQLINAGIIKELRQNIIRSNYDFI